MPRPFPSGQLRRVPATFFRANNPAGWQVLGSPPAPRRPNFSAANRHCTGSAIDDARASGILATSPDRTLHHGYAC